MNDWQKYLVLLRDNAAKVPKILWVAGFVILTSFGAVLWLEMSGPPYAVLDEGLSPTDGGKVIAQLQKLGIPYQLQAAGNIILVPQPQLAQARLQLGEAQVPGSDVQTAWSQLENAPMTASDLAQSTMAMQALELSLQQSIQSMSGIRDAQVFLALPRETPFLADQPKPTASVIIEADAAAAQAQGQAIADLVAGAVPGLNANDVTVETTAGISAFPINGAATTTEQLGMEAQVEANATARISGLLIPIVGAGNFETDVSANLDFTQEHIHQTTYGPSHLISHQSDSESTQYGDHGAAIGIPGALSNEPPSATTASTGAASGNSGAAASSLTASVQKTEPSQKKIELDQTYVTDQSESDITPPDWTIKSIAVSVVLNKAALGNAVTVDQVKAAVSSAFAYPNVNVNVLVASFQGQSGASIALPLAATANPLAHAMLEVMSAAALLFGLALPVGRRLAGVNIQMLLTKTRPLPSVLPLRDFSGLREQAAENIPGVARLLQNWAEEDE